MASNSDFNAGSGASFNLGVPNDPTIVRGERDRRYESNKRAADRKRNLAALSDKDNEIKNLKETIARKEAHLAAVRKATISQDLAAKSTLESAEAVIRLQEKTKKVADGMAETIKSNVVTIRGHEATIRGHEDTIYDLKTEKSRVETDLITQKENFKHLEDDWNVKVKELADEKAKHVITKAALDEALTTQREQTDIIKSLEKDRDEANEKIEEQIDAITEKTDQFDRATEDLTAEKDKVNKEKERYNGIVNENVALLKELTEKDEELANLATERDNLKVEKEILVQAQADLREARETIAAHENEILKLRVDAEQKPFDTRPTAYATPSPVAEEPEEVKQSLEEELGGDYEANSDVSSERAHSEERSEEEVRRSSSPETPGEDETVKIDDFVPFEVPPLIQTVTKTVYLPVQGAAHNPLLCWIHTEIDLFVLFAVWVTFFLSGVVGVFGQQFGISSSRRSFSQTADDFHVPAPSVLNVPSDFQDLAPDAIRTEEENRLSEANQSIPSVEQKPHNGEATGDPNTLHRDDAYDTPCVSIQPPVDPAASRLVSGASPPIDAAFKPFFAATPGNDQYRTWYQRILSPLPNEVPSVSETLWAMLFHFFVYSCIGLGYLGWRERQLWLAANDHTRIFLLRLIENPHGYRNLVQKYASPLLSENWRRSLDVFIFKYFVEQWGLQHAYALPG